MLFEILSSFYWVRIAPYILMFCGLLMKSHAELNIGRTFWYLLSKLTCTSVDIAAFQPSGFPDKTGFCSYCFTFDVGFCNLLLYVCVFVSSHGLIFLNLLYGEPLFPLFFLFSAVITHQFLFNKIYDRKKSSQCKRFRPILNSSGTCAGWDRWGHN